jgi:hypothetical protein
MSIPHINIAIEKAILKDFPIDIETKNDFTSIFKNPATTESRANENGIGKREATKIDRFPHFSIHLLMFSTPFSFLRTMFEPNKPKE